MAYTNGYNPQNPGPELVQGSHADIFILGSTLLADNPNLLPQYFNSFAEKPTFLSKIKALGFGKRAKASSSPITGHYEKGRMTNVFTVGAIETAASGAGDDIEIALAAGDMQQFTDELGTVHYWSRPRATEIWEFADRNQYRIESKDETVNPHTLILKPLKSTVNANTGITVGAKAAFSNPSKGEATGQIAPTRRSRHKYQNTFAILDDTQLVSGTNLTTKVSFTPVPGKPNLLYLEGVEDMEILHEKAKSNLWLFGQTANNITDYSAPLQTNVPVRNSEGLIQFGLGSGKDYQYDPNSYDLDDIYAMSDYYHDMGIGTDTVMLMQGRNLNRKIDFLMKDFLDNSYVSYLVADRYMSEGMRNAKTLNPDFNSEAMFLALEFGGYRLGGMNFVQVPVNEFNNTQGHGAIGYMDWQVGIPLGSFKDADGADQFYMGYEWRGAEGYDRENEVWINGGAGKDRVVTKSSEFDVQNTYIRSEIAPHFGNGVQVFIQRPQ